MAAVEGGGRMFVGKVDREMISGDLSSALPGMDHM